MSRFMLSVSTLILLATGASSALAAGHYSMGWWREKGYTENGGGLVITCWVFDENGNPKPNVDLKTSWGVLMGATDARGYAEIPLWNEYGGLDIKCADSQGSTSDVAYPMTTRRYPHWGHYSYEVGFLYKTDGDNSGTFDQDLYCTLNLEGSTEEDAPYTKSLAYNSINCANNKSDAWDLGNWSSYFGQTFKATGNRVFAARAHGTIGGNNLLSMKFQILTWPEMTPISPIKATTNEFPFGWVIAWGVDDVPVTPGETYFLKVWRDPGGMNMYSTIANVYADGQYYEAGTGYSGRDLIGFVCCMDVETLPPIEIISGPEVVDIGATQATVQWTTDVAGDSRVDYGPTSQYGSQATNPDQVTGHQIILTGLVPSTLYHYQVTTSAESYLDAVSPDLTFVSTTGSADMDGDGDVDLDDFGLFQACMTGSGVSQNDPDCYSARLDIDTDVDQEDLAAFLQCFSGANIPAPDGC